MRGRLTAISNLLSDLRVRAYREVMKRAVYSHPAGLGVHLLQINVTSELFTPFCREA